MNSMVEINSYETSYYNIKNLLLNNKPIDNYLHVICVYSNPHNFKRRYKLAIEFINRMLQENNIKLYVCEMKYDNDSSFHITDNNNPNHLQLISEHPLWHKENMINLCVQKLLPYDWKAMAWIDADIEFGNINWVDHTLKLLNSFDILQPFSVALNMDINNQTMELYHSWGYEYVTYPENYNKLFPHCGYAWACTRDMYDKMNGLIENHILGSGDLFMAKALTQNIDTHHNGIPYPEDYLKETFYFIENVKYCKIGYVPGEIRHYYHGSIKNRQYGDRRLKLIEYNFRPSIHLYKDENGVLCPTELFPRELLIYIKEYFKSRNDDDN